MFNKQTTPVTAEREPTLTKAPLAQESKRSL